MLQPFSILVKNVSNLTKTHKFKQKIIIYTRHLCDIYH